MTVPPIPGLAYAEALISPDEEAALIAAIDATDLAPFRFQGWVGKRRTASFGWRYDFDDRSFTAAEPIPDAFLPVRDKAAAFAGLPAEALSHILLIRYDPGAGIGWHRDRPVFDQVLGISLGAPTVLRFRHRRADGRFARVALEVAPRSIYHLTGEARRDWEHSIAAMAAVRWSITCRSLSARGLAAAASQPGRG